LVADYPKLAWQWQPPTPDCWYYATQCHGDVNDDVYLGLWDFYVFRDSWGCTKDVPCGGGKEYAPCADSNRDGTIGLEDFYQFRDNWGTTGIYAPPDANCALGDINGIYCP
jgi:hypothetical protein